LNKLLCFFGYISVTTDPPEMASHWDLSSWPSLAPRKRYLGTHCRVKDGALPLKPTYGLTCGRLEDETGLWPPW